MSVAKELSLLTERVVRVETKVDDIPKLIKINQDNHDKEFKFFQNTLEANQITRNESLNEHFRLTGAQLDKILNEIGEINKFHVTQISLNNDFNQHMKEAEGFKGFMRDKKWAVILIFTTLAITKFVDLIFNLCKIKL